MDHEIEIKYFPTWRSYLGQFRETELTHSQLGWLWLTMMEYQFENKEPEKVPKALKLAWSYIRRDLDDARKNYESRVQNGRKGGRKKNLEEPKETGDNQEEVMKTKTLTKTKTKTLTKALMSTDTGSAPAQDAGVCCEAQSFGEFGWIQLTAKQYETLREQLGYDELQRCITYVDEAAQSTGNRNRWKDWYLILRRCHENHWYETRRMNTKPEIPKGASGTFGAAELEAIQRVLREG